jgi:hypothetical protein
MFTNTLRVGVVYVDPSGPGEAHALCLDLAAFRFFIDTEREFVPLGRYLRDHPERRDDVAAVLTEKLG